MAPPELESHALEEEHCGESAASDLVRYVALIVVYPDCLQLLGQVSIAQVAPFQFGLQQALHNSLIVLRLRHF